MAASVWSASESGVIPAPIEKVWNLAGDFAGLIEWAAPVFSHIADLSCEVEGDPRSAGAVRVFKIEGGKAIVRETLLEIDEKKHRLSYRVDGHPLLVGYISTLELKPNGDGSSTNLQWRYEIPATNDPAKERIIADQVLGFYRRIIELLQRIE